MRGAFVLLSSLSWQAANSALCNKHDPFDSNLFFPMAGPTWLFYKPEENCDPEYPLSRCYPEAYLNPGTNWTVDATTGYKTCEAFSPLGRSFRKCTPSKFVCNDTLSCPDLLDLRTDLMAGGYNIVCRHEKTYWPMLFGEVHGCSKVGNCLTNRIVQRKLHPDGYQNGVVFANAFKAMGIPMGKIYSSDMDRCINHAKQFGEWEHSWQIQYEGTWRENADYFGFSKDSGSFPIHQHQAHNMRDILGTPPAPGTNNILVTHGFNMYRATGLSVDEGYCLVFKPDTSQPKMSETVGTITIPDTDVTFTYSDESYPLNFIARMSPESAKLMQTCGEAQEASQSSPEMSGVFKYDLDSDMRITWDEYNSVAETPEAQAFAAFTFLGDLQPQVLLGKEKNTTDIEVGQWFHIDWGWNDLASGVGTMNFWRNLMENTIGRQGRTPEESVAAFVQANAIMSAVMDALQNAEEYPDWDTMQEKLLGCETTDHASESIKECVTKTNLATSGGEFYFPMVQPGSSSYQYNDGYHMGKVSPLPASYVPDFFDSKLLKAAVCLVQQENGPGADALLESMGCPVLPPRPDVLPGVPLGSYDTAGDLAEVLRNKEILDCKEMLSFGSLAEFNEYLQEMYADDKSACKSAGGKYSSGSCRVKGSLKCKKIKMESVCDGVGCTSESGKKCSGTPQNLE